MKFDYAKGEKARYIVNVSYPVWNNDHYYYHYYKDAMEMFERLKKDMKGTDARISVYDMEKDVRKAFAKL